ncbi:LOW QUALITY PROTEIN: uncharacterized protein LOC129902342 [Solanum dulcamara]|uniref:LOW QUALITY PROTEIN: uncharacterized protein LOC129902342 n=1 Tax=Solanum dulcamara TaxID=45834 RepID=UPI00248533E7|nr:LOW QUALITY PROTEIN: uncharacterized protein LOC129902342 [Solanum dulcamara]
MQCMHGAKRIHLCNVCHVLLLSLLFTSFLHKNTNSLSPFLSHFIFSHIYIFMDYSPPLSPLTSPESTPPASPPYYIEEPKTLTEQQLNEFREAALHIINTHTPEEATKIFLEGLIPVNGVDPRALPKEKKVPEKTGDKVKNGNFSGTVDNIKK